MPKPRPLGADVVLGHQVNEGNTCNVSESGNAFNFGSAGFRVTHTGVRGPTVVGKSARVSSFEELDIDRATRIGSGSSGKVYNCIHKPTGQQVVVKVIDVDEGHARQEILKELEALYTDTSRFIVDFIGAFFHEGQIYITLERMDASLLDAIRLMGTIKEQVCRAIAKSVMQGLLYLHSERRKIHRDIKPSNILIHSDGVVKITDFGVSSGSLNTTNYESETFVGTVTYMSPERLCCQPHSYGADIWSLGLLLTECATGLHPYTRYGGTDKLTYWNLFLKVDSADSNFLSTADGVSDSMVDFVSLCLKKDPADRPSALSLLSHPWLMGVSDTEATAILKPFTEEVAVLKMRNSREKETSIKSAGTEKKAAAAKSMLDSAFF